MAPAAGPGLWLLSCDMAPAGPSRDVAWPWPPGRDVGSGCYPDLAQGFGGGAGFGARPVLTSLSEPIKNYQSRKRLPGLGAAPSSGVLS